ncbi:F-box only protein 5-like [Neocloeon triangulifer]|uniref:F-box only protein 5-like n=1 Tax=Neocloeon triangulifer TaxID=2078957 RepID=UPI00286EC9F4|nr:F-box only protein 5-like [Neocloeon triangulifer]
MDTMMNLWKDGLAPLSTHSPLFRGFGQTTDFKSPENSSMEDSGYSTCTSTLSVDSCNAVITSQFKTPCCYTERKSSKRIISDIPASKQSIDGKQHVNFLEALSQRDILDEVLRFLSPDDLIRCSLVSKSWKGILEESRISRTKRSVYLSTRTFNNKENLTRPGELTTRKGQKRLWERSTSSTPLATITSSRQLNFSTPVSLPVSPSKVPRIDRFEVFREAGNSLRSGESQVSCPRCSFPARNKTNLNLGVCTNGKCRFQFCLSCRCEQHTDSTCILLRSPEKLRHRKITKQSYRRNMRRL